MQKITEAVDEAYHIGGTLIFLLEYPVENVAMDGRIQSENPKILAALKKMGAGWRVALGLRSDQRESGSGIVARLRYLVPVSCKQPLSF